MHCKAIIPKVLILFSTLYAMIRMWHWIIGFTYFTQLSNLFTALAVAVQLVQLARGRESAIVAGAKFAATVSIFVTFLVYLCLLAPMMPGGPIAAYRQDGWASLCLHLVTPLLTLVDFLLNDARRGWSFRHALSAVLPPIAYFLFVLALGTLGVRWYRDMSAPYLFLNYAAPCGWFGFMPETASSTTLGIGVFYVMILLMGVFLAVGMILVQLSRQSARIRRLPMR